MAVEWFDEGSARGTRTGLSVGGGLTMAMTDSSRVGDGQGPQASGDADGSGTNSGAGGGSPSPSSMRLPEGSA